MLPIRPAHHSDLCWLTLALLELFWPDEDGAAHVTAPPRLH